MRADNPVLCDSAHPAAFSGKPRIFGAAMLRPPRSGCEPACEPSLEPTCRSFWASIPAEPTPTRCCSTPRDLAPHDGVLAKAKSLTTKHDLSIGLTGAVEAILPHLPQDRGIADIAMVSISTTLATNAIVEKHGAPICLILMGYDSKALERAGLRQAMGTDPVVMIAGGHKPTGEAQARARSRSAARGDRGTRAEGRGLRGQRLFLGAQSRRTRSRRGN